MAIAWTYDGWTGRIPLNKSEKDFTLIANLPPGPYEYKFIVDGKWRYAPDLPTVTDRDGNVNNTVEVKELPRTQDQKLGGAHRLLIVQTGPGDTVGLIAHLRIASGKLHTGDNS